MNKIITATILLSLISCSSKMKKSESIEEKISRFESRSKETNPVPSYHVSKIKKKKARGPASADERTKDITKLTNRKVYFLSLYEQYLTFSQIYPAFKKEVKTCASFHQEFITYNEAPKTWSYRLKENISDDIENVVWHLPYGGERANKETLPMAVKEHMDRNFSELKELCHNGFSDNYYVYENYITLAKKSQVKSGTIEGANSIVKMSVVFNKLLIENLTNKTRRHVGRGLASTSKPTDYTNISFDRLKADWFAN